LLRISSVVGLDLGRNRKPGCGRTSRFFSVLIGSSRFFSFPFVSSAAMADDETSVFEAIRSLGPLDEAEHAITSLQTAESSPDEFSIEEIDGLPWLPPLEPVAAPRSSEPSVKSSRDDQLTESHSDSPGVIETQAIVDPVARSALCDVPGSVSSSHDASPLSSVPVAGVIDVPRGARVGKEPSGASGFRRGFFLSGLEPSLTGSMPGQGLEEAQGNVRRGEEEEEEEDWREWISLSNDSDSELQYSKYQDQGQQDHHPFPELGIQEASELTDTSACSGLTFSTTFETEGDPNEGDREEAKAACFPVGMEGSGIWSNPLPVDGRAWEARVGLNWGNPVDTGDLQSEPCGPSGGDDNIEGDPWVFDNGGGVGYDDEVVGRWVDEMEQGEGETEEGADRQTRQGGMGYDSTWPQGGLSAVPGAAFGLQPAGPAGSAGSAGGDASAAGDAASAAVGSNSGGTSSSGAAGAVGAAAATGAAAAGTACWSAAEVKQFLSVLEQQSQRVLQAQRSKQSADKCREQPRQVLQGEGVGRWMGMGEGESVEETDVVDELAVGHAELAGQLDEVADADELVKQMVEMATRQLEGNPAASASAAAASAAAASHALADAAGGMAAASIAAATPAANALAGERITAAVSTSSPFHPKECDQSGALKEDPGREPSGGSGGRDLPLGDEGETFFDEVSELERELVARWAKGGDAPSPDEGAQCSQAGEVTGGERPASRGVADTASRGGEGEERTFFDELKELEGLEGLDVVALEKEGSVVNEHEVSEPCRTASTVTRSSSSSHVSSTERSTSMKSENGGSAFSFEGACSYAAGPDSSEGLPPSQGSRGVVGAQGVEQRRVHPGEVHPGKTHLGSGPGSRSGAKGSRRGAGFRRGFLLGGDGSGGKEGREGKEMQRRKVEEGRAGRKGEEKANSALDGSVQEKRKDGEWKVGDSDGSRPASGGSPGGVDSNGAGVDVGGAGGAGAGGAGAGAAGGAGAGCAESAGTRGAPQGSNGMTVLTATDEAQGPDSRAVVSPPTDVVQAAFTRLHPLCMAVVDARGDNKQLPRVIKRLEEAIGGKDVPVEGLQACLEFLLFPLMLVVSALPEPPASAATGEGRASSAEDQRVAGIAPRGRQRVVEAALSCMHVALVRCPVQSLDQAASLLRFLASATSPSAPTLPPPPASSAAAALPSPASQPPSASASLGAMSGVAQSEEARLLAVCCLSALLSHLPRCSPSSCCCAAATASAADGSSARSSEGSSISSSSSSGGGGAGSGSGDGSKCVAGVLQSQEAAPLLGHLLSNMLSAAEAEARVGTRGSRELRVEALRAVRHLVSVAHTPDSLAFFLPGILSGLSRAALSPFSPRSNEPLTRGAAADPSAVAEALLGLSQALVLVLGDAYKGDVFQEDEGVKIGRVEGLGRNEGEAGGGRGETEEERALNLLQQMVDRMEGRGADGADGGGGGDGGVGGGGADGGELQDKGASGMEATREGCGMEEMREMVVRRRADSESGSAHVAGRGGERNGSMMLRVDMDEEWMRETGAKVLLLLQKVLPKLLPFPSPKVRCALTEVVGTLLQRCSGSLSASRPLLLECLLILASDEWPSVAFSARHFLASVSITDATRGSTAAAAAVLAVAAPPPSAAASHSYVAAWRIEVTNAALEEMVERHMASLATPTPPTPLYTTCSTHLHSSLLPSSSPTLSLSAPSSSPSPQLHSATASLRVLSAGLITAGPLFTVQRILDLIFSDRLTSAVSHLLAFAPGRPHTLEYSPAPAVAHPALAVSSAESGVSSGISSGVSSGSGVAAKPGVPAVKGLKEGEHWRWWLWEIVDHRHQEEHHLSPHRPMLPEKVISVLEGALPAAGDASPHLLWFCRFLRVLARLAATADATNAGPGSGGVVRAWQQQPIGALPALFQPLLEGLREAVGRIGEERRRERREKRQGRAKNKERMDGEGKGGGGEKGKREKKSKGRGKDEGGQKKSRGRRKEGRREGDKQGAERREENGKDEGEQELSGQVSAARAASSFLFALNEALAGICGGPWVSPRGEEEVETGAARGQKKEEEEEEERAAQREDRWHAVVGPVVQSVLGELLSEDLWGLPVDVMRGGERGVQSGGLGEWMGEEERRRMMRTLNENANLQAVLLLTLSTALSALGPSAATDTGALRRAFPRLLHSLSSPHARVSAAAAHALSSITQSFGYPSPSAFVAANMDYAVATVCDGLRSLHCHPSAPRLLLALLHLLPVVPVGDGRDSPVHLADSSKGPVLSATGPGGATPAAASAFASAPASAVWSTAPGASVVPSALERMLPLIIHPIRSALASLQITARLQHASHLVTLVQVLRVLMSACAVATSAKRSDAEAAASAAIAMLRREERARAKQLRKLRRARESSTVGPNPERDRDGPNSQSSRGRHDSDSGGLKSTPDGNGARLAAEGSNTSSSCCGVSSESGGSSASDSKTRADPAAVRAFFTRRMRAAAASVHGDAGLRGGGRAEEGEEEENQLGKEERGVGKEERGEEGNSSDEEWENLGSDTESEGYEKDENEGETARESTLGVKSEGRSNHRGKEEERDEWSVRDALTRLSDRTRGVAMQAQLAAACLEACGPLMASRDAELALLASDVVQASVAAMSTADVAQRARANELEAVREVVRLRVKRAKTHLTALQDLGSGTGSGLGLAAGLSGGPGSGLLEWVENDVTGIRADLASLQDDVAAMHETEDALKVADAVRDETNWLLPRVHMIWPHAVSGLKRDHPALITSSIHVITALCTTCDDAFMARKIREDSWPLMASLLLHGPSPPLHSSSSSFSSSSSSVSSPFLSSISSRSLTKPSRVDLTRLLTLRPVPGSGSAAPPSLIAEPAASSGLPGLLLSAPTSAHAPSTSATARTATTPTSSLVSPAARAAFSCLFPTTSGSAAEPNRTRRLRTMSRSELLLTSNSSAQAHTQYLSPSLPHPPSPSSHPFPHSLSHSPASAPSPSPALSRSTSAFTSTRNYATSASSVAAPSAAERVRAAVLTWIVQVAQSDRSREGGGVALRSVACDVMVVLMAVLAEGGSDGEEIDAIFCSGSISSSTSSTSNRSDISSSSSSSSSSSRELRPSLVKKAAEAAMLLGCAHKEGVSTFLSQIVQSVASTSSPQLSVAAQSSDLVVADDGESTGGSATIEGSQQQLMESAQEASPQGKIISKRKSHLGLCLELLKRLQEGNLSA
ncbi:hypothetical protein CLOM_g2103, partial [Closterium sp. NIES-68]